MKKSTHKKLASNLLLQFIGKSSPIEEMRKTFYRVIIVDMFWLDGDLPKDPDQKFEFALNPQRTESSKPSNYIGLRHISEELLIYVCSRFERPDWVDQPGTPKLKMSLNEIVAKWPMLFDLPEQKS